MSRRITLTPIFIMLVRVFRLPDELAATAHAAPHDCEVAREGCRAFHLRRITFGEGPVLEARVRQLVQ